ncbi:hypothetical protein ACTXQV_56505, partial [Klebsiella pneumoniae]
LLPVATCCCYVVLLIVVPLHFIVPALEINPGLILTENVAILPFLAQHDPKQDLIPPSGLGRAKVLEWLGYLNSELHDAYAVFFGAPLTNDEKTLSLN